MRICLLGNLLISIEGRPIAAINTNRLQSLLAYLILHSDTPQPRERLAFVLWPGSGESQARTNLRQLVHHLKRALPAGCSSLVADHFVLQWRQDASCSVDVIEFQEVIARAVAARSMEDRGLEIQLLMTAAQLYQDDLLPALYDDWLTRLREDYRRRLSGVLRRLAELFELVQDYSAAIPFAERLVALDSLSESHHQLLIRLHAANLDRASALRAYHRCMRVLRREMGVEPGAATQELFERILKTESGTPGEPGIGKSRLADELYQSCVRQGHTAARARCYAGQGQVAYAPVAEWLRSEAVRAGWTNLAPQQLAELTRLVPEIAEQFLNSYQATPLQPRPLAESWQRLQFYDSLNAAFGKMRKPALLYLDDLQWCDPDSLEWLNALVTSLAASPVLLLGTVRAEETGREHPDARRQLHPRKQPLSSGATESVAPSYERGDRRRERPCRIRTGSVRRARCRRILPLIPGPSRLAPRARGSRECACFRSHSGGAAVGPSVQPGDCACLRHAASRLRRR